MTVSTHQLLFSSGGASLDTEEQRKRLWISSSQLSFLFFFSIYSYHSQFFLSLITHVQYSFLKCNFCTKREKYMLILITIMLLMNLKGRMDGMSFMSAMWAALLVLSSSLWQLEGLRLVTKRTKRVLTFILAVPKTHSLHLHVCSRKKALHKKKLHFHFVFGFCYYFANMLIFLIGFILKYILIFHLVDVVLMLCLVTPIWIKSTSQVD